MTFEKAKQRNDYKFSLNGIENLIEDIRNNCMKNLYENGDGYRGVAVLEIGCVFVVERELEIKFQAEGINPKVIAWFPNLNPEPYTLKDK